ncbi:MAG: DUF2452 domain-containing protein [Halioglobus sp.]
MNSGQKRVKPLSILPNPKPNPQGKGVVPILQDLERLQNCVASRKSAADFLRDYCVSSMILQATFQFQPVVGKHYFLYARDKNFALSLIAPHEWGTRQSGEFLGLCQLRSDMTWEMNTTDLRETSMALAMARDFIKRFMRTLAEQDSIDDNLPFYVSGLPYHQRVLGTALASSLRQSMPEKAANIQALLRDQPDLIAPPMQIDSIDSP